MNRREILKQATAVATAASVPWSRSAAAEPLQDTIDLADGAQVRQEWVRRVVRLADPVLGHLAQGTLKRTMPVEGLPDRRSVTHLEAVGRTLAGIAPWLALPPDGSPETRERTRLLGLARDGLRRATDPKDADALNFTEGAQPLVDAAFLAHAIVRAPQALWHGLDDACRTRLGDRLRATREIAPGFNNWLLFSAMVESALRVMDQPWDVMRVDYALRQHMQWYRGDGVYSDGPSLHCDYYNSFVIHPMLLDVLRVCADARPAWTALRDSVIARARRFAAILERLVASDGSFPPVGRSLAYRCGAFQLLAQMALSHALPESVPPPQARAALDAVIRRTLDAPRTFTDTGWLRIGFCGHQPGIAERYISTGSLYLCTTAFLPLGLPSDDAFWKGPGQPWTSLRAWAGEAFPIDAAIDV